MRQGPLIALLLALALVPLRAQSIALTHVTVIDATDTLPRGDQTVVVRGNRIAGVGPSATLPLPPDARVIDGAGAYVIPGLWDMHVHAATVAGRAMLALYVANGVTGVRDMGGDWDSLRTWRGAIARGELAGPRIVAAGPYIEGGDQPVPHLVARTADEARRAVDSLVALGVDFVKLHTQLKPEVYYAAARRARERGIPLAGHVSSAVGALSASDSGVRSIEHLLGVPLPCTEAESIALRPRHPVQGAIGRCSSRPLATLYEALRRNHTWVTPTMTAMYEISRWPMRDVPGDTLAHYLPDTLRAFVASIFPVPDDYPAGADSVGGALLAKRLRQVAEMQRAGIGILTGTDAPLRNSPPGFGLHEELALLASGGMSNAAVLRAATWEPAAWLGALDSLGSVAPGKVADLVLLDANPLDDIRNTRRIRAVVANGRYLDSRRRLELLAAPVATAP